MLFWMASGTGLANAASFSSMIDMQGFGNTLDLTTEAGNVFGLTWLVIGILAVTTLLIMFRRQRPGQTPGSFHYQVFRQNILLVGGVVLTFLVLNTFLYYRDYHQNLQQLENRLTTRARYQLTQRVKFIQDFIEQERNLAETHLRAHLKSLVDRAFQSIDYLVRSSAGRLSKEDLTRQVMETLRPIRYSDGRGYMFATSMDGIELLFADHPELEGQNLLDLKDQNGVFYIKEMIRLCREQGEGYVTYCISKPGSSDWNHPKIAYVRYLKELDCFIGTGEYLNDFTAETQKAVADRLNSLQHSGDLTIFGGTMNGISLFGPARGKNLLDVVDNNGVKVVQELIKAASDGGGFVNYDMPPLDGKKGYPKMSLAVPIAGWDWYIGSGINLNHVNAELAHAQKALKGVIITQVLQTVTMVSLLGIFLLLVSQRFSARLEQNIFSAPI